MARSKDIDIDDSVFQQRARLLAKKLGKDEKEFIKQQTGILAREVAKFTPPFDTFPNNKGTAIGKKADEKMGKWAVYMDIKWICTIKPAKVIAKAKRSWGSSPILRGSITISKGVIDDVGSLRAWHNANQRANNRTKPLKGPMRYWVSDTVFAAYVKEEQKKVGIAKAAFAKASVALGAKGAVPAWVKKHMGIVSGTGTVMKDTKGSKGVITGRAGGLFHTISKLPAIRKNRLIKAVKRGEYVMKQAAKDSNFKVV